MARLDPAVLDSLLTHEQFTQVRAATPAAVPGAVSAPPAEISGGRRAEGGGPRAESGEPIVWGRGDKYARGACPDQAAGQDVPVTPAVVAIEEKKPVTLDVIIEQYRKSLRMTTRRHIFIGQCIHTWIARQPDRPANEQLPRAAAMMVIERRILAEGLDPGECRPNRDLKTFHAARLLGGDGESLAISAIRHVLKLVERDKATERWRLRPDYADRAKALWGRMLAERLTAAAVKTEVDKILPPKASKSKMPWGRQAATVLRLLPHLTPDELVAVRIELLRCVREEKAKSAMPAVAVA